MRHLDGVIGEVDGPQMAYILEGGHCRDLVAVEGNFGEVAELGENGDHGGQVANVPAWEEAYLNSMLIFLTWGCASYSSMSSYIRITII